MTYLQKPGSPQEVLDELTHHGIKGMKWGVRGSQSQLDRAAGRTTKKLNKASQKADLKSAKSKRYSKNLKDSDSGAIKNLKPTAYARYLSSGARVSQLTREKQLKKSADRGRKTVAKVLDSIPEGYSAVYDVSTRTYTLRER